MINLLILKMRLMNTLKYLFIISTKLNWKFYLNFMIPRNLLETNCYTLILHFIKFIFIKDFYGKIKGNLFKKSIFITLVKCNWLFHWFNYKLIIMSIELVRV